MKNNKVYCPIPWTEVHINADGTYHACGAQPNRVSGTAFGNEHNVHNMSIRDWMQGYYQQQNRINKLNNHVDDLCNMCYREEELNKSSKRKRELDKYPVIPIEYTSPHLSALPVSYHISLGNECNLACRMCGPVFSSASAAEQKRLGIWSGPVKMNWTEDQAAWNMVINTMSSTENLQAVHVIGGEPLLNDRFERMVDALIAANLTNIYIGFTTNGTVFNQNLVEKLNVFRHVDIGISIETADKLNDFVRTGSNTSEILHNTQLFLRHRKQGHVYVTIRTVPSALSVHSIDSLFRWCIENQVDVMSNMLFRPEHLRINNLPLDIKQKLLKQFSSWPYSNKDITGTNDRDPTYFKEHIDHEMRAIVKMLEQPADPALTEKLYATLEQWGWFNDLDIRNYFFTAQQHN